MKVSLACLRLMAVPNGVFIIISLLTPSLILQAKHAQMIAVGVLFVINMVALKSNETISNKNEDEEKIAPRVLSDSGRLIIWCSQDGFK